MADDPYRDVTDFSHETSGWVHTLAELGTASDLLLLAALLCAACVGKLRRTGAYGRAAALITPAAVAPGVRSGAPQEGTGRAGDVSVANPRRAGPLCAAGRPRR